MGRQAIPMQINAGDYIVCSCAEGKLWIERKDGGKVDLIDAIQLSGSVSLLSFDFMMSQMDMGQFGLISSLIAVTHGLRASVCRGRGDRQWFSRLEHATAPASVSQ